MGSALTINDDLFAKAASLAEPGIEKSELIRKCVKAFIQCQTARRLTALGGQSPDIELVLRRREEVGANCHRDEQGLQPEASFQSQNTGLNRNSATKMSYSNRWLTKINLLWMA